MKRLYFVFALFLVMAVAAGCASTKVLPNIKKGKTTSEEVRKNFGEPDQKSTGEDGHDIWRYTFAKDGKGVYSGKRTVMDITFVFDAKSIVDEYEIDVAQEEIKESEKAEEKKEVVREAPPRERPGGPKGRPPFRRPPFPR